MNKIGIMQGRLLPKLNNRYQAHPSNYWQEEFNICAEFGIDCIEFILDFDSSEENPLIKKDGIDEIQSVIKKTNVTVESICADYFMEAPLHSEDSKSAIASAKVLSNLIPNASNLGVRDIVIPCVDQSSINSEVAADRFINNLMPIIEIAEDYKINLSLETDLPPSSFLKLLNSFNSRIVTVNYDIGNSAALGYNLIEELDAYGERISDIHIKDRNFGGSSVVLGEGNAEFDSFFQKLKEFNYQGPFIMQAYRDDEGVEIFKKQLDWISPYLNG